MGSRAVCGMQQSCACHVLMMLHVSHGVSLNLRFLLQCFIALYRFVGKLSRPVCSVVAVVRVLTYCDILATPILKKWLLSMGWRYDVVYVLSAMFYRCYYWESSSVVEFVSRR